MMNGVIFFCLVTITKFSLFSRSDFRSVEKTTTMSKRIQERKKEEELAVTKQRTVCLGQSSSFGPGSWFRNLCKRVAGNCLQNSVERAALQHCAHNQMMHYRSCQKLQHSAHDHVIPWWCGKLMARHCPRQHAKKIKGCGELQRKIQMLRTTKLDHHNLPVRDCGYVEKVFTSQTEDAAMFDLKTSVLTLGLLM